jgi:uncharacterized protein (TIGR04255 family)
MPDAPLPKFEKPPVNEVALGAQFSGLAIGTFELARLADALRAVDPGLANVVERGPLPPMPPRDGARGITFQLQDAPDPPLFWLLDESSHHLIQIQRDRLVVNWRKLNPDEPYPSFESILPRWQEAWNVLATFIHENELGDITPNACEVTYFNAIDPTPDFVHDLVSAWSGENSDTFLPSPAELRLSAAYPLPNEAGSLTIEMNPAVRQDTGSRATLLSLSAKGWPSSPTNEAVVQFFKVAHEWIVRGFASFTTTDMHIEWERTS